MKESKKTCCPAVASWISVVLIAILLVGGALLGTKVYKKVSVIHKLLIEWPYGSASNFEKIFDARMTPQVLEQIDKTVEEDLLKIQEQNGDGEYSDVDVQAAMGDPLRNANATEAYELFGIGGTPGNVIIDKETGAFKVIGGAYPQESFEEVIAQLKEGKEVEADEAWTGGKLTEEEMKSLLEGVYYLWDENAEIVILEYSDLLCPFCKRHHESRTLENIVEADSSVARVFKNMPLPQLHANAPLGAKGVECAGKLGGKDAFYTYLDKAFQKEDFTANNVINIAKEIWLDTEAFIACFTK